LHGGLEPAALVLWGERSPDATPAAARRPRRKTKAASAPPHPFTADAQQLRVALAAATLNRLARPPEDCVAWLPTQDGAPVASSALIAEPADPRKRLDLAPWTVAAHRLSVAEAVELMCGCVNRQTLASGIVVGKDLGFAVHALRFAGALVARQRFLPDLEARDGGFRALWRPVLEGPDAQRLRTLAASMPDACRALGPAADAAPRAPALALLERFVGALVDHLVRSVGEATLLPKRSAPAVFHSAHDAWLHALRSADGMLCGSPPAELSRLAAQVREWQRPAAARAAAPFRLTFRLEEPNSGTDDAVGQHAPVDSDGWYVRYLLQGTQDPSLLVPAERIFKPRAKPLPGQHAGFDAREALLASLGQAASVDANVERGLRSPTPSGHALDATGAFDFLSTRSAHLEQAGFGVLLPSWWTRTGTKGRLTVKGVVNSPKLQGASGLTLDELVRFDCQIALGDDPLSAAELRALAQLKVPLVRVRGQWVQVSAEEIQTALAFWKKQTETAIPVREVVRMALGAAQAPAGLVFGGVQASGWVGELLSQLDARAGFDELPPPEGFHGTLRPYQLRGYSWLAFLGRYGFGACLADDMGLGKTVQALALLQHARRAGERRPMLLICPTSVVGNWEKEAARFTPDLPVLVHHGLARRKGDAFRQEANEHALVISSYALLQRDLEVLRKVSWSALILDEAQNVKNAQTKQAKAARSIPPGTRIALTGTPVENNVGDLWSLMEFLNPGLLGTQAEFKRRFFLPIQADRDAEALERLRCLTGPFILRRLKSDKSIIADLPEKMEMKVYCTLTREQASLYQAVVSETEQALEAAEGIQRKGLVLATLSKLKQVCNHPAQFLGDNSAIEGRSGKLARLTEMLEEVLAEGDRALVFSQFAQMGAILKRHLQESFGREALFLHGGTPKRERDRMVERFQAQADAPPLFILSLKAGGTGLNLTSANHVFHFDRWWNPAVENQATDRAFRIGQKRRVQVHKFVCAGTLEERIDEMIERKQELAQRIVGAGESWLTELSTAELRDIMALRGSAVAE
jgi:SNF2 family DNA or RNA helicase